MKISKVVNIFDQFKNARKILSTVNLFAEKCNIQYTFGRSQIGRVDILVPHSSLLSHRC